MTEAAFVEIAVAPWARVLAVGIPVSAIVGVFLVYAWRRVPPGRMRTRMQWAGVILLFVVPMSAVMAWNASFALVIHQRAALAAWALVLAATGGVVLTSQALAGRWSRTSAPSGTTGAMLLFFVFASGMAAIVGANLLGDVAHPRLAVEGVVEEIGPPPDGFAGQPRPPVAVVVDGEAFLAVGEVRAVLRPGMYVRGEAFHRTRTLRAISVRMPPSQ